MEAFFNFFLTAFNEEVGYEIYYEDLPEGDLGESQDAIKMLMGK